MSLKIIKKQDFLYVNLSKRGSFMLNIAIIDDQEDFCVYEKSKVESFFSDMCINYKVDTFSILSDFLCSDQSINYDIVLLDYIFPNTDCFSLLETYGKILEQSLVIIVTSCTYIAPIKIAFKYNVFRYITKDNFDNEIGVVLEDSISHINNINHFFVIEYKHKERQVFYKDLIGVYTEGHYVILQFKTNFIRLRKSLKEFSKCLENHNFVKLKSNIYINPNYIKKIDKHCITMEGNLNFELSKDGYKKIREILL